MSTDDAHSSSDHVPVPEPTATQVGRHSVTSTSVTMNRFARRRLASQLRKNNPEVARRMARMEELVARVDDADYVHALEQNNRALTAKEKKIKEMLGGYRATLEVLDAYPEYYDFICLAKLYKQRADKLEALRFDLREIPRKLPDVLSLAAQLYPDSLAVTDAARKSAEDAAFQDPWISWRLLRALATELPKLLEKDLDIPKTFQSNTGFELTLTESSTTRHNLRLMRQRAATYVNRNVYESGHVKYGNRAPKLLRVHFRIEVEKAPLIVTHCGDHLETAGTRRMT